LKAGEAGLCCASGRSGILARQPANVFVPAAGASPHRQEDHGAGPTKTAGWRAR